MAQCMRAYIGTLSCKVYCLPQVVHDANAVSSMYVQCHICRMAVLHDGTHCIRAMQYGVH
ncbi:hypothetical protein [Phocaeicola coprophilus]|uniref:hypothetical protein n=1 Tax=Phocaeicola coprophilus TaxID=387090 RepID=UPI0039964E9C